MITENSRADALTDDLRDAIEYAIQVLQQVEAGDGTFVGQCADAISGLEGILAASLVEQPAAAPIEDDDDSLALALASVDPCPFCGSENVDSKGWLANDGRSGPACDDCGATAESVEGWNRRVPAPSPADERAASLEHDFQVDRASGIEICTRCGLGKIAARRSPVCGTPTVHGAFEAWLEQPHPNNWNDCNHPLTVGERQAARFGWEAALQWQARAASASETGAEGAIVGAWRTDDGRAISAEQKAGMLRDGGAGASSVRPYSIPCYLGSPAMAAEPTACKGKNCGSLDSRFHSAECFEEYEKTVGLKPAQADARGGLRDGDRALLTHAADFLEQKHSRIAAVALRALLANDRA